MKRTLLFPAAVADAATAMGEGGSRKDELLEGAFWVLERNAESGQRLWQDPPLYAVRAQAGPRGAAVSVLYTIDHDRVVVLSLAEGNADSGPGSPIPARLRGIGPEDAGY
jgi:hypothetical protein